MQGNTWEDNDPEEYARLAVFLFSEANHILQVRPSLLMEEW
jgi:hypothetical protein